MNQTPLRVRWMLFCVWLDAGPWLRAVPSDERCCMGFPYGEDYRCRRRAVPGLWCAKHDRRIERERAGVAS